MFWDVNVSHGVTTLICTVLGCVWYFTTYWFISTSLHCKEIQPVHPKGDQSWLFTGRTEVEAETPILWPPDAKSWFIWKDPNAGKDWRWEKKGTTEDEMVEWHCRLNGHEFEPIPGVGDGQGDLACCSPRGRRVGQDWATELNDSEMGTTTSIFYWWGHGCSDGWRGVSDVCLILTWTLVLWKKKNLTILQISYVSND